MQSREGYLKEIIRVFGCPNKYDKAKILIDPNYPNHVNYPTLEYNNWREFYLEAEEMIPDEKDIPDTKRSTIWITVFKGADHAHNILTRRSVTGILLMINNTLIKWFLKRQKTVKTSTYESELVAAK